MTIEEMNTILNSENSNIDIQRITLDFDNKDYKSIREKQYDKNSRYLIVTCCKNGQSLKLMQNLLPKIKMITPDDRPVLNDAYVLENGQVFIELTESMLAAPGKAAAELNLYDIDNNSLISTMEFEIMIEASVYDNDRIIASDEFNTLTNSIIKNEQLQTDLSQMENAIETEELIRQSNETERITNEQARQTNESNREDAESNRQINTASAISNTNTAAENANTATRNANNASIEANEAASNANTVTQEANAAIEQMKSLMADDNIIHSADLGVSGGVATLDENGNVPASQLPSFVDDAIEGIAINTNVDEATGTKSAEGFILSGETEPCTPESGKIYVDTNENVTYRWTGSGYVSIGSSLTLGTNSSTAFPGDRGLGLENRVADIEAYHNNIPAADIKFNNSGTDLLAANVQNALIELTNTATETSDGRLSKEDKLLIDNYKNIIEIDTTLPASAWTGASVPYMQILSNESISPYNNCSIALSSSATPAQEAAMTDAQINSIEYDASLGIIFKAYGEKPSIDLPIVLCVGTSMNVVEVPNFIGETNKASSVSFDPSASSLSATDVQSALDELADSKIGTTDISAIGDGSCTGAIAALNSKVTCFGKYISNVNETKIGILGIGYTTVIGDIAIVKACIQTRNTISVNEAIISTGLPAKEGISNLPCIFYNNNGNTGTCELTLSTDGSIMPVTELIEGVVIHIEFCYKVA